MKLKPINDKVYDLINQIRCSAYKLNSRASYLYRIYYLTNNSVWSPLFIEFPINVRTSISITQWITYNKTL